MHLAVLVTNTDDSDFAKARPRDAEKFRTLFAAVRPGWRISAFDLTREEFPAGDFDGYVIGGSPASVQDDLPWIARLEELIRSTPLPIFGACFGHQVIAKALGGEVSRRDWVFGAVRCDMAGAGQFTLAAAHHDQVTRLPTGAQAIASHEGCPIGGFRIGTKVFTTQNHPEIDDAFLRDLVAEYAPHLPPEVAAAARASLAHKVQGVAFAELIARFFEG